MTLKILLENVSEMVAETSETSKDQQSESATGKITRARVAKSAASKKNTRARARAEFAI